MLSFLRSLGRDEDLDNLVKEKRVELGYHQIGLFFKWEAVQCTELHITSGYKNPLVTIPKGVFSVSTIEILVLCRNYIKLIPNRILQLKNLTTLELNSNFISQFPSIFHNLPSLTYLDLSQNSIRSIGRGDISPIPSLQTLKLNNNPITSFPKVLCLFPKLEILELDHCEFHTIQDDELEGFPELRILILRSKFGVTLPKTVNRLQNLERLIIGTNRLPSELSELQNLKDIHVLTPEIRKFKDFGLDCIINLNQYFESAEPYFPLKAPAVDYKFPLLLNGPLLDLSSLPTQFISDYITVYENNSIFQFFAENNTFKSIHISTSTNFNTVNVPSKGFIGHGRRYSIDSFGNVWQIKKDISLYSMEETRQILYANNDRYLNLNGKIWNEEKKFPSNIYLKKIIKVDRSTCALDSEGNIWHLLRNFIPNIISLKDNRSTIVDIACCDYSLLSLHSDGSITEIFHEGYNTPFGSNIFFFVGRGTEECYLKLYNWTLPPVSSIWCTSGKEYLYMIDREGSVLVKTFKGYYVLPGTPPNVVEIGKYKCTGSEMSCLYLIDENRNCYEYDTITKKYWEIENIPFFQLSRNKSARK